MEITTLGGGGEATTEKKETQLQSLYRRFMECNEEFLALNNRLDGVNDRISGPIPENDRAEEAKAAPDCLIEKLSEAQRIYKAQLNYLAGQCQRLEDLA